MESKKRNFGEVLMMMDIFWWSKVVREHDQWEEMLKTYADTCDDLGKWIQPLWEVSDPNLLMALCSRKSIIRFKFNININLSLIVISIIFQIIERWLQFMIISIPLSCYYLQHASCFLDLELISNYFLEHFSRCSNAKLR